MDKLNLSKQTAYLTKEQAIGLCNEYMLRCNGHIIADTSVFKRDEYYYNRGERFPGLDSYFSRTKDIGTVVKYLLPLIFEVNKFTKSSELAVMQMISVSEDKYEDAGIKKLINWGITNAIYIAWSLPLKSTLTAYNFEDRANLTTRYYDFGFTIEFILKHIDELICESWDKIAEYNIVSETDYSELLVEVFNSPLFSYKKDKIEILNQIYRECFDDCWKKSQGNPDMLFTYLSNRGLLEKTQFIADLEVKLK